MKSTPPAKASTRSTTKPRELAARLAAAKSKAESARKTAEEAKAVFKRARKTHKHAKKVAKAAKREVKTLKKLLVAAKLAASRARVAKARKTSPARKAFATPAAAKAPVIAPLIEQPTVPAAVAVPPPVSESPQG